MYSVNNIDIYSGFSFRQEPALCIYTCCCDIYCNPTICSASLVEHFDNQSEQWITSDQSDVLCEGLYSQ